MISQIGTALERNGHRVSTAPASMLAPAFVDPHVHLRVPGREDEETIGERHAAAAAGGYCAILAMPNTDPVVDSAAVLGALDRGRAPRGRGAGRLPRRDHEGPGGRRADGDGGARRRRRRRVLRRRPPVVAPGLMRRALQYGAVSGRKLALHCEEPTLSRGGHMHEGAVSAELGFGGYPSVAGVADGRARPRARGVRAASLAPSSPLGARIGRRARAAQAAGVDATAR